MFSIRVIESDISNGHKVVKSGRADVRLSVNVFLVEEKVVCQIVQNNLKK